MTLPHQGLDQSEKRPLHPSFIELSVSWQSLLAWRVYVSWSRSRYTGWCISLSCRLA